MPESFVEKLERANQHLNSLESDIHRWLESKPYTMLYEPDLNTGENIISIDAGKPPETISPTIGDCVHNLRSSLDHLVYSLAIKNRSGLTDEEAAETSFPIFKMRDSRVSDGLSPRGRGRIKYLSIEAQTIIKGLQPFHAGKDATLHWLWILEKLNNIDKHRRLLVTATHLGGIMVGVPSRSSIGMWEPYIGPIKGKTELTRLRASHMDIPKTSVQVEFIPTLTVAFVDPPAEGRHVLLTLESIRRYVLDTVLPPLGALL
ncbi:MAG: hypothetical protein WBY93_00300 [Candidatus Binatus sp.]